MNLRNTSTVTITFTHTRQTTPIGGSTPGSR